MAGINVEKYKKADDMCDHESAILQQIVKDNGSYRYFVFCPHGTCRHYQIEKTAEKTPLIAKKLVAEKGGIVTRKDIEDLRAYLGNEERIDDGGLGDRF